MRHVIFRIGSERYGLPLAAVREVVEPAPMSRVPCSPEPVLGIMNLRGRVVTVVSLGALMGIEPAPAVGEAAPAGKVVILDRGRRDLGLLVGEVDGVHTLGDLVAAPGEAFSAVRGVGRPQTGGAVTVLEAEGLDRQIAATFKGR
ncbi:MAG TPA: chemotaxis protein CheW [Myxococcales bacterium]|mgnify:CR=1 FL=1|jgi:purine-binding chemotaxis protein CheW|nr:chemotaxis protein CheW [Myxococcales bacterium]